MKSLKRWMPLVSLAVVTGCTTGSPPVDDGKAIATGSSALVSSNDLEQNALSRNALGRNALAKNALAKNALAKNSLDAIQDPGSDGELARSLVRYSVVCAFDPSQSFEFSWTDSSGVVHNEEYFGHLGLAPHWASAPLGEQGERTVTACLAAHVNYYGVSVWISVRSGEQPLRLHPLDEELDAYPNVEGAFWGNLWASEPYISACYNPATVNNSHSFWRDCATGHVNPDGTTEDCGVIKVVGPCTDACVGFNPASQYYTRCVEQPGSRKTTNLVITTALP